MRANDKGDLVVTKGDQYDVREQTTENEVYSHKCLMYCSVSLLFSPFPFSFIVIRINFSHIDVICMLFLLKVRNLGKPVELAGQYYTDGADEVCPSLDNVISDLSLLILSFS